MFRCLQMMSAKLLPEAEKDEAMFTKAASVQKTYPRYKKQCLLQPIPFFSLPKRLYDHNTSSSSYCNHLQSVY